MERLHTAKAETATWTCPECGARNRELADEFGGGVPDNPCGRCGWEPFVDEEEPEDDYYACDTGNCTQCGSTCLMVDGDYGW